MQKIVFILLIGLAFPLFATCSERAEALVVLEKLQRGVSLGDIIRSLTPFKVTEKKTGWPEEVVHKVVRLSEKPGSSELFYSVVERATYLPELNIYDRRVEVAKLMHGYFTAVADDEASLYLGKVLWTGIASRSLRFEVRLPEDVAVRARNMSEKEFVGSLLLHFKSNTSRP